DNGPLWLIIHRGLVVQSERYTFQTSKRSRDEKLPELPRLAAVRFDDLQDGRESVLFGARGRDRKQHFWPANVNHNLIGRDVDSANEISIREAPSDGLSRDESAVGVDVLEVHEPSLETSEE